MQIRSVLFIGQRNAARSIMAETCFNAAGLVGWRAFSAGWQTQLSIDAMTLRVLGEQGFPTDTLSSKPVDIFRQQGAPDIELSVFMDERLPADVASYPGRTEHWRVDNPHGVDAGLAAYREALRVVTARISDLILSGRLPKFDSDYRIAS
jgi:arsenate reductase (thioredoxin)